MRNFYNDKLFMNTPWLMSTWNKVTKTNNLSCLNTMINWFILTCNKSHHCCIKNYIQFETVVYIWLLVENILFVSLITCVYFLPRSNCKEVPQDPVSKVLMYVVILMKTMLILRVFKEENFEINSLGAVLTFEDECMTPI